MLGWSVLLGAACGGVIFLTFTFFNAPASSLQNWFGGVLVLGVAQGLVSLVLLLIVVSLFDPAEKRRRQAFRESERRRKSARGSPT